MCRVKNLILLLLMASPQIMGCASVNSPQIPAPGLATGTTMPSEIALPAPKLTGTVSLEEALVKRRSIRNFSDYALSLVDISQLLWAAQGITDPSGFRTAPSAGGLYPLEIYLAVGRVTGLETGVYRYEPEAHKLVNVLSIDRRSELAAAAVGQMWISDAAAIIVISAVYERTTSKYGERGIRYVHMEAGHSAQNVCLQAVALGIATTTVGAFDDQRVAGLLGSPSGHKPLYLMPVGSQAGQDR